MTDNSLRPTFAVCVANDGCDDLSAGMLYRVLPDDVGASEGLLRVIDDSGEDYLYPSQHFVIVEAPRAEEQKLLAVAPANVAEFGSSPSEQASRHELELNEHHGTPMPGTRR